MMSGLSELGQTREPVRHWPTRGSQRGSFMKKSVSSLSAETRRGGPGKNSAGKKLKNAGFSSSFEMVNPYLSAVSKL